MNTTQGKGSEGKWKGNSRQKLQDKVKKTGEMEDKTKWYLGYDTP